MVSKKICLALFYTRCFNVFKDCFLKVLLYNLKMSDEEYFEYENVDAEAYEEADVVDDDDEEDDGTEDDCTEDDGTEDDGSEDVSDEEDDVDVAVFKLPDMNPSLGMRISFYC
jgi:hypothetical protein